jgi:ribose 5-phosphate isomerase RpiB
MVSLQTALEIVRIWLETPFEGGRHQRRIDLIDAVATAEPAPTNLPAAEKKQS